MHITLFLKQHLVLYCCIFAYDLMPQYIRIKQDTFYLLHLFLLLTIQKYQNEVPRFTSTSFITFKTAIQKHLYYYPTQSSTSKSTFSLQNRNIFSYKIEIFYKWECLETALFLTKTKNLIHAHLFLNGSPLKGFLRYSSLPKKTSPLGRWHLHSSSCQIFMLKKSILGELLSRKVNLLNCTEENLRKLYFSEFPFSLRFKLEQFLI